MSSFDLNFNDEIIKERDKIVAEKEKLEAILSDIDTSTNNLKECWQSETSEKLFLEHTEFKNYLTSLIKDFDNDIKFLDENVINKYKEFEFKANNDIENKITS